MFKRVFLIIVAGFLGFGCATTGALTPADCERRGARIEAGIHFATDAARAYAPEAYESCAECVGALAAEANRKATERCLKSLESPPATE